MGLKGVNNSSFSAVQETEPLARLGNATPGSKGRFPLRWQWRKWLLFWSWMGEDGDCVGSIHAVGVRTLGDRPSEFRTTSELRS